MKQLNIRIAGKTFGIQHRFDKLSSLCLDYVVKENTPAEIVFKIKPQDIGYERKQAEQTDVEERGTVYKHLPENLECSAAYRKIADSLLDSGILLMHGAAVAVNGKAYIFLAKSGVGKTTHIRNWIKCIPNVIVINGDKPLVDSNNLLVYGTPWSGKENLNTNTQIPLAGLCLLKRGIKNSIEKIPFSTAVDSILQFVHKPETSKSFIKIAECIHNFRNTPCYELKCNMEEESAKVSYNFMREADV